MTRTQTTGFKVIRTWAFDDVPKKPSSGPYFQVSRSFSFVVSPLSDTLEKIFVTDGFPFLLLLHHYMLPLTVIVMFGIIT